MIPIYELSGPNDYCKPRASGDDPADAAELDAAVA